MNAILEGLSPIAKAIVPLVVMIILAILAKVGIMAEMTVQEAVTLLVTAGLVWAVPNRK